MIFSRNIGLISEEDQQKLSEVNVLITGVGGMGGVCAELLVRMGVCNLTIVDHDIFEETNFNRQLHANVDNVGRHKVEVLKEEFLKINPDLNIRAFADKVDLHNVEELLEDADYVVNGMDEIYNSLVLERNARKKGITIVDAWLTPYASVFVMTPDSPHWEEFLDLPTQGIPLEEITPELCAQSLQIEVDYTFDHFNPYDLIEREMVQEVITKKRPRPSFGPVVWLSGVMLANEIFKIATGRPHADFKGVFFNQYDMSLEIGKAKKIKKVA